MLTMSLREQIEQLKPGESFTTVQGRAAVFVAAKRAGVEVTTSIADNGFHIMVTRKGEPVPELSLVERVAELSPTERLELFENFELCCGMNRGECVCLREADLTSTVLALPTLGDEVVSMPKRKLSLDELRDLMANPKAGETDSRSEPVDEDWRFTKDAPQFADDGNVYRKQVLAPAGKKMRTVRVDADDHELILSL